MTSFAPLVPIATEAVERATRFIRTNLPRALAEKGDRDMVSEVDLSVERAVRAYLNENTPAIGFLGEEEGRAGAVDDLLWVLDPVDGTANFVRGLPLCAVSLALVSRRKPVLGVIALPFLQEQYVGLTGEGAHDAFGRRIRVSGTSGLVNAIVALGDYAVGPNAAARNRARLAITELLAHRAQRVRMLGSAAVDLVWTAAGRLDASVMLSNKPWDTAAGVLIAREAGAHVVDRDGSPHTVDSTATLAAAPTLLDDLLALVREAERA